MDDRSQRIESVRSEIERELATGSTLDTADWGRRYPDLQPELGELLAELLGLRLTVGPPQPGESTVSSGPTPPSAGRPTLPGLPASGASEPTVDIAGAATIDMARGEAVTQPGEVTSAFDLNSAGTAIYDGVTEADGTTVTPEPGQRVRYVGDYELLSVLGRGGMGVVFRARQISLKRPVALKMIGNSEFASEDQIRRFHNEAEAVATLDHVGIVPIYEVGSYHDHHYFSMKLIDGRGMEKALADLKNDPREAARIVAEVADAIHHAHQRGILHRDLKPANILLDREQHAHVTDFGLAKRIEGDDGLTVPGSVMGTPAYMSPEQASGQTSAITTASDVYGLGAILFAALTDRAPFVGNSVMLTLDRVRNNPPDAPHRLNPGVPRDLEVICLKCLEKEPRHRYGSALEVAGDLRRWLIGEPITARPVGPAVRLTMWARRKPALAGLSAALIVASIVGVIGIAWQWREAVYQRDQAVFQEKLAREAEGKALISEKAAQASEKAAQASEKAAQASEKTAVAAKAQAEQNALIAGMQAALALATIQDLITRVNSGLDRPGLQDLKDGIIQSALARIDGVANIFQGVTNKEATTLAAMTQLGRIYRETGQIQKAVLIFQKCLEIAKERLVIKNRNASSRNNLANIYRDLAGCAEELDRDMKLVVSNLKEALTLFEDIQAKPTTEDPNLNPTAIRAILADVHQQLGTAYHHLGEINKSLDEYRQAFNLRSELLVALKDNPTLIQLMPLPKSKSSFLSSTALSALAMADCSDRLGRREAAEGNFRQALDLYEQVAKDDPNYPWNNLNFANYHAAIGNYHFRNGNLESARSNFEKSRERFASVAKADERNAYQQRELMAATTRLAQLADVEKKPELARREYDEAVKLAEEIFRVDEKNDLRRIELMLLLPHVGQVDRAVEIADRLSAGPKVDPELRTYLAETYAQSARALPPEKAERAQVLLGRAVEAVRQAINQGFRDRAVLDHEHDLDPLRAREDFQALLRDLPPPG